MDDLRKNIHADLIEAEAAAARVDELLGDLHRLCGQIDLLVDRILDGMDCIDEIALEAIEALEGEGGADLDLARGLKGRISDFSEAIGRLGMSVDGGLWLNHHTPPQALIRRATAQPFYAAFVGSDAFLVFLSKGTLRSDQRGRGRKLRGPYVPMIKAKKP